MLLANIVIYSGETKKKTKQKTYLGKTKYKNTMIHHRHDLEGEARSQVTS